MWNTEEVAETKVIIQTGIRDAYNKRMTIVNEETSFVIEIDATTLCSR